MSYRTEDIAKALHRTHGMIFLAASELGCAPVTIYRRAEKSKEIQGIIDSYRGQLIDKAELKLEQAVMSGEPWAVQFCLKTIGKKRGYVERQEITGEGGDGIVFTVKYADEVHNNPTETP